MKIFNTLTRKKEEFKSIEDNKIKIYSCGPTVYSFIHIGNARPMVIFDTLRRYFEYKGMEVIYVQNYTDVDDKIINKSIEEGVSSSEISERYIAEALIDEKGLNIKMHTHKPKVTEEMDCIIQTIELLLENGNAYVRNGTVYFNTKSIGGYGDLSKKNIDELEAGSRVSVDVEKQNSSDFLLWKPAKQGEPKWNSPWGDGRPGWHIECSAMIKKYLGNTIDIHCGGEDLIFPHHENELIQSKGATGKSLANFWMHNGFINVDNQKMSKSKGNFFTIRDITKKYSYDIIRFFILSAHYRTPINFSDELLQSSENALNRIKNCAKNLEYIIETSPKDGLVEDEKELLEESLIFKKQFEESLDDDFNTADAITAIFELVKFANIHARENSSKEFAQNLLNLLITLSDVLGLRIIQSKDEVDTDLIEELIGKRQEARKNKDFQIADNIRLQLNEMHIILEDTSTGIKWSYDSSKFKS